MPLSPILFSLYSLILVAPMLPTTHEFCDDVKGDPVKPS